MLLNGRDADREALQRMEAQLRNSERFGDGDDPQYLREIRSDIEETQRRIRDY